MLMSWRRHITIMVWVRALSDPLHDDIMDYNHTCLACFDVDSVLRELIPDEIDAPASFEVIGHIAHLNLRHNQLPYKHLIGRVILDVGFSPLH